MDTHGPKYQFDEFARRGEDVYERIVKPGLKPEDDNKVVAIDIETEEFDIDEDEVEVTNRMTNRHPNAQLWLERVGCRAVHRIGGSLAGDNRK